MIKLTEDLIQFKEAPATWEEAIKISANLLLEKKYINEGYIQKMIDSVKEFGPYIVIVPEIAMPHARPDGDVLKGAFSVTVFDKDIPIVDVNAKTFITLACAESSDHMKMIQKVANVLDTDEKRNLILNAKNKEEIIKLFEGEE